MQFLGPSGRTRNWLRNQKFKLLTSIGRSLGNDVVTGALTSRPEMAAFLERLQSAVPQGQVLDTSVTTVEHRDWRGHFAGRLHGSGLELGPLHRPLKPHPGMRMTYMDRADQETLKREFPAVAKRHRPGRRHRRRRDARHRRPTAASTS